MIFKETKLSGSYIIEVQKIEDERGFFAREWCRKEFEKLGLNANLAQCNISYNRCKGTLRGMHYQVKPYEESKLVRCIKGKIYDVIIDLRKNSSTYKQWIGVELSHENAKMIYVPEGFAHGFQTLEDDTYVYYQVTEFYTPKSEQGIMWNEYDIDIKWPIKENIIMSEKDKNWGME